jgi:hypothetical protein
MGYI